MKFTVVTLDAKDAGEIELKDVNFMLEPRVDILHRIVNYQLAKRRAGTAKTKERNEVSRTGKKCVRQKGSGGARHGDKNAHIFVGGGVAHGARPRSHAFSLTKKFRKLALRHALSAKCKAGELIIVKDFKLKDYKTKEAISAFNKLGVTNGLVVTSDAKGTDLSRAVSNIKSIDVLPVEGVNVYDILRYKRLLIDQADVVKLEERLL